MTDYSKFLKESNLTNGSWHAADSRATIPVTNPATGEIIGHVPNCGTAETERAIRGAAAAFKTYSPTDVFTALGYCVISMMP